MVTVLSKKICPQCDMTKKLLTREGIPFEEIRMDEDEAALARAKDLGYLQAPVVITESGEHWSGFRPDLIKTLKQAA